MAIEIVDFPMKNSDFPWQNVSLPEGKSWMLVTFYRKPCDKITIYGDNNWNIGILVTLTRDKHYTSYNNITIIGI